MQTHRSCVRDPSKARMRLMRNDGNFDILCLPSDQYWDALVITDCHFTRGEGWFPPSALEPTLDALEAIIHRERPHQLITLGDLFHHSDHNQELHDRVVRRLLSFGFPVYMLPGNHDKHKHTRSIPRWKAMLRHAPRTSALHVCPLAFFGVVSKELRELPTRRIHRHARIDEQLGIRPSSIVYLTHDGRNSLRLQRDDVPPFLRSLKEFYQKPISPSSYLITGHVHKTSIFTDTRVASLGCFNDACRPYSFSYLRLMEQRDTMAFQLVWKRCKRGVKGLEETVCVETERETGEGMNRIVDPPFRHTIK
eukprot:gnl/Trimastix_PCT/4233.p1 GENE.gnl/Trimastix_PCT/4233~~gnl/Trimastix_PCT/4233.p1  ORF type:complete len:331 (+),score=-0.53 gnl/Trimastix_PCT/4233:71-994(+)